MFRRVLTVSLVICVAVSVFFDPYTWYASGNDLRVPGPWWQSLLAAGDLLLLGSTVALLARGRVLGPIQLLAVETMYNTTMNALLVARDGIQRFVGGVGASQYLSTYLVTLGCRALAMVLLLSILASRRSGALELEQRRLTASSA